jgi:secondary thiamine-phosphate synthase enzyme
MSHQPLPRKVAAPEFRVYHDRVDLRTERRIQFIDLTELVAERVRRSGIRHGTVQIQTRHTTTAIVVNENEPLLQQDLEELMELWAPGDVDYRHDDLRIRQSPIAADERVNGDAHARAVLLGCSQSLNVVNGQVDLGRWQRIFLVELDGARKRSTSILVIGLAEEEGDEQPLRATAARERALRGVS